MAEVESIKSDVLPYDFVKENEVIVSGIGREIFVASMPTQNGSSIVQDFVCNLVCFFVENPWPPSDPFMGEL